MKIRNKKSPDFAILRRNRGENEKRSITGDLICDPEASVSTFYIVGVDVCDSSLSRTKIARVLR